MNIEKWENGRLRFYFADNGRFTSLLITDDKTTKNGFTYSNPRTTHDAIVGNLPNCENVVTQLLSKYDKELTASEEFVYDRIESYEYQKVCFIIPKVSCDAIDLTLSFDDNAHLFRQARMLTGSNKFINKKRVWDKLTRCMFTIDYLTATVLQQSKFQYKEIEISDYYVVYILNEDESEL